MSCLVVSCLVVSCLVVSCLVVSCLVLNCIVECFSLCLQCTRFLARSDKSRTVSGSRELRLPSIIYKKKMSRTGILFLPYQKCLN